jgi:hypothetical protein
MSCAVLNIVLHDLRFNKKNQDGYNDNYVRAEISKHFSENCEMEMLYGKNVSATARQRL